MPEKSISLYAPRWINLHPYTLKVEFSESRFDIATNTSTLSLKATLSSSTASFASSSGTNWLSIYWYDNNKYSTGTRLNIIEPMSLNQGASVSVSGTITVPHKADGTLSGYAKTWWTKSDNNINTPASGDVATNDTALTTIPRASTPSLNSSSIVLTGSNSFTINTNRASNDFTHTLTYEFGSATGTIGTAKGVGASINWTPPITFLNQFEMQTSSLGTQEMVASKTGKIYCTTYKGNTQIGNTTDITFTLNNPKGDKFSLSTNNLKVSSSNSGITYTINAKNSAFTHNLYWWFDGGSVSQIATGVRNTYTWKPVALLSQMSTTTSKKVNVSVDTLYNGKYVNSYVVSSSFTLSVDTSVYKPIFNNDIALEELDGSAAAVETAGTYIRYVSDIGITGTLTEASGSGATISSVTSTCGSKSVTQQTSGAISATFQDIEAGSISITAKDTRGATNTKTLSYSVIPYIRPTLKGSTNRPNPVGSDISLSISGNCFKGSFGSVNNSLAISYQYKASSDTTWTTGTTSIVPTVTDNNTYSITVTLDEEFNYQTQYDLKVTATDYFNSTAITLVVQRGIPVYHWGQNHFDVEGNVLIHEEGVPTHYVELETSHITTQSGSYTDTRKYLGVGGGAYDTYNNPLLIPSGDDSVSYWQSLNTGIYWKGSLTNVDNLPFGYGFVYVFRSNTEVAVLGIETGTNRLWKKWVNGSTSSTWLQTVMNTGTSDGSSSISWGSILNRNWGSNLLKVNHTGMVQFRLNATWAANTSGATLCTLPVGYRPTTEIVQNVKQNGTLNTDSYIQITTAGLVKIYGMTAANGVRHTFNFYAG